MSAWKLQLPLSSGMTVGVRSEVCIIEIEQIVELFLISELHTSLLHTLRVQPHCLIRCLWKLLDMHQRKWGGQLIICFDMYLPRCWSFMLMLMPLAVPAVDITYTLAIVHPVRPAFSPCRHEFLPAVWIGGLLQARIHACSVQKVNTFSDSDFSDRAQDSDVPGSNIFHVN